MSESREKEPQDDSDEDIYKDFSDFNFGDELAKLEQSKETIKKEALDLSEQVKVLTRENEELKKSNEVLKKNISSLLKTAQAEVQRKDTMLNELRNKLDSLTFRRKNKTTKDAFTSTQDLEITRKMKNGCEESKSVSDKNRSKSKECRSSSESEKRSYQEGLKRKDSGDERESLNCDNNRKFGYYRDCTRRKSRHSNTSHESYNKRESHSRKSTKNNEPEYRGSFNDNHKDHLKYHSLDRRKRSRSSDRRFTYRRRSPRARRSERMEESPERWRKEKKEDISEGSLRRRRLGRGRSRSRERSKGSKESSLDPLKTRSPDTDSGIRSREISNKLRETNSVKMENDETKKERGHFEKEKNQKNEVKAGVRGKRISKEENPCKNEKASQLDKFSTRSPLDALYSEMMVSRSANRFCKLGSGVVKPELDSEGDKFVKVDQHEASPVKEDWTLSFKNERREPARPMTLYSRRMMQKLSEAKETERSKNEEKITAADAILKETKNSESEKEPGELTDDENIVESSKEFQELAQVASMESAAIEKSNENELFKEPIGKEPLIMKNKAETDVTKSEIKEKSIGEENKGEKNDEIVTPGETTQFLDFFLLTTSPFKPIASGQPETPGKIENTSNLIDVKSDRVNCSLEKVEDKNTKKENSKTEDEKKSKKDVPEKTTEKKQVKSKDTKKADEMSEKASENKSNSKTQKRKRDSGPEGKSKKIKLEESHRKRTRSQQCSENRPDQPEPESQPVPETKVNEDITTFEFFKPIAKKDALDTPAECKMTAMSVTNIVCLETPNKSLTTFKNLMISEQRILNVLESKNTALCSPLTTPRRLLKNDLMLTDSEDDLGHKGNVEQEEEDGQEMTGSDNSGCESDSGASDFVDLL